MLHVKLCLAKQEPRILTYRRQQIPSGRWGRFPTHRAATLLCFRWKGCSKSARSWMSFPGTFPGEYTVPLQNFGTQKWHYSQYLIWKQVWKPVPQFNLDQTSHLLWDTSPSSLVWFSRNNMFLWSKWNLLLVEMLLWMNSGWWWLWRAAESGVCTGQVGVLCPQAQVRTST